jgi:NAD(P)-dependent dehydrogenase (short-subunit alcohol dehydrogenase family)
MKLKDKVIIVTGGGRGIGRAASVALAENGAKVAIVAKTNAEINSVADEINSDGNIALPIMCDVSDEKQVKEMVKIVNRELGIVDVLINNAAIFFIKELINTKTDDWDRLIAVNLRGVFLCTREVIGQMMERRSGKIINVSSRAGRVPLTNFTAYGTSKYGIIGFTETLALEMSKYNIFVNAVCPDRVITKMSTGNNPEGDYSDWLKSEDLAELFVFLSSDGSRSINGSIINAYGFAAFNDLHIRKNTD